MDYKLNDVCLTAVAVTAMVAITHMSLNALNSAKTIIYYVNDERCVASDKEELPQRGSNLAQGALNHVRK